MSITEAADGSWRQHLQHFLDLGVNHSPGLRRRVLLLLLRGICYDPLPGGDSLPKLPSSGERLVLRETTPPQIDLSDSLQNAVDVRDDDEAVFESMWKQIEQFIDEDAVGADYTIGTAGEIWPSNAALCAWLSQNAAEMVAGATVLELGAGMGACGLYAAALGASRVLLTDLAYDSEAYRDLCQQNIEANRRLFQADARVELATLRWGDEAAIEALCEPGGFDLVLLCDCTFGQYALDLLCRTLAHLLRLGREKGGSRTTPLILLAHEHRYRGPEGGETRGMPWLRQAISSWDEGDECLEFFCTCAKRERLKLTPVWSERPRMTQRGLFRWWSADLSIVKVDLDDDSIL